MNTKHLLSTIALAGTSFVLSSCYSNTSGMIFDKASYNAGVKASDIKSGQTLYSDGQNYYTYVPRYRYDMPSYFHNYVGSYCIPDIPVKEGLGIVKKSNKPELSEKGTQLVQLQPEYAQYLLGKGPAPAASTLTAVDKDVLQKCMARESTTIAGSDTTLQQFDYSSPNAFWLYTAGVFDFLCVDIPFTCIGNAWYFVGGGLMLKYMSEEEYEREVRMQDSRKKAAEQRAASYAHNSRLERSLYSEDINEVRWGIRNGANMNATNHSNMTPLMFAARIRKDYAICRVLLEAGASVYTRNGYARTALHEALRSDSDNYDIVNLLLNHGAVLNDKDKFGLTPLHLAACHQPLRTVQMLVGRGANLYAVSNQGHYPVETAYHDAQYFRSEKIMKNVIYLKGIMRGH